MTHQLASGNKVTLHADEAQFFSSRTGMTLELSPRKAVVMVLRDAALRGRQEKRDDNAC